MNRLNITIIIGLPIAMLAYLYANRLIHIPVGTTNYEIYIFFSIWLSSFILACLTPQQHLWKTQLKILICAAFMLPLIDLYYLWSQHYLDSFANYWLFLRIDLMLWILALRLLPTSENYTYPAKAVHKIQAKLKTAQQESSS